MLRALLLIIGLAAALPARADTLLIFAAASTKTALDEVAADWQDRTGHRLLASYAGSSALARQIAAGAPADLFLSANTQWMDDLDARGLLLEGTRTDLLGNRLAVIAHADAPLPGTLADLPALAQDAPFAMALTEAVPAGIYGKAALDSLGLWPALQDHVVQTDNARTALALVAAGEAPYGLVYATDARVSDAVRVAALLPPDSHPPIVYPVAVLRDGQTDLARSFLEYLQEPTTQAIFADAGFVPP